MSEHKNSIICPVCGKDAKLIMSAPVYKCDCCGFFSDTGICVDVSYKDEFSAPLSNLYPHGFDLLYHHPEFQEITIVCPSMESFLQGLKIKDPYLQCTFMTTYSGMTAKKDGNGFGWMEKRPAPIFCW